MIKLTGVWKQESKDGNVYYSGNISNSLKLLIFKNKDKVEGDTKPDFILYLKNNNKEGEL